MVPGDSRSERGAPAPCWLVTWALPLVHAGPDSETEGLMQRYTESCLCSSGSSQGFQVGGNGSLGMTPGRGQPQPAGKGVSLFCVTLIFSQKQGGT